MRYITALLALLAGFACSNPADNVPPQQECSFDRVANQPTLYVRACTDGTTTLVRIP